MKTTSLSLALWLSAACSFSAAEDEVFMISSWHEDKLYRFGLTKPQIDQTPVWREDQLHPPLAPRTAMTLARAYLTKLLPDSVEWPFEKLAMQQVGDRDHWAYLVSFMSDSPGFGRLQSFTVLVRMDGQIPEARVEPIKQPRDGRKKP
jgi:hypothetical protein